MKLVVRVESPPDEPSMYEFREPSIAIGRSPRCDIVIPTEHAAERHHARFFLRDKSWFVENSGKNSLLNGMPVATFRLQVGDQFRIGDTIITIHGMDS